MGAPEKPGPLRLSDWKVFLKPEEIHFEPNPKQRQKKPRKPRNSKS